MVLHIFKEVKINIVFELIFFITSNFFHFGHPFWLRAIKRTQRIILLDVFIMLGKGKIMLSSIYFHFSLSLLITDMTLQSQEPFRSRWIIHFQEPMNHLMFLSIYLLWNSPWLDPTHRFSHSQPDYRFFCYSRANQEPMNHLRRKSGWFQNIPLLVIEVIIRRKPLCCYINR